jgi:diaminohydroxyphosphoribosylaminopyrimidine deaminase/5-amino-6-(5-phosphoribosylamino)uracil reductase
MTTASADDEKWMRVALDRAAEGRPSPNPHVGALVVKNGSVLGEGHHERAGDEHAEIAALNAAGGDAAGATLYVTLEPCNHQGRTPPCTDAIIASKVARVVVGCRDPNPHVKGGGIERLSQAGIVVTVGVLEEDARRTIAPWTKFVTTGLPYVSLKLALSLDGRIATRTGHSKWVTGPEARQRVHVLRAAHDAVAIGIGTVLADDPRLTVRDAPGASPLRVVFDTRLRLPANSRLAQTARDVPLWIVTGPDVSDDAAAPLLEQGIEILRAPSSAEGRVDVVAALQILAENGVVKLLVEGGAELAGSFLAGQNADEMHAFVAPLLLGPRGRPGAVDWAGPATTAEAPRISKATWELCGEDAYVHGPISHPA